MKLGIMQPYFFPHLGYFDLIRQSERWVVFDTVQYIRHGWVNRNRILHPTSGWQYVLVPLRKHARNTAIENIETQEQAGWRQKIVGQLAHYRKHAPFFRQTMGLVEECLEVPENRLSRLNTQILSRLCAHLEIPFDYDYFSAMSLDLPKIEAPGDWAPLIAEKLEASEYVNPPGGQDMFESDVFSRAGVRLTIRDMPPMPYACPGYTYHPRLSIIDVLMWNPPEDVLAYLDQWSLATENS